MFNFHCQSPQIHYTDAFIFCQHIYTLSYHYDFLCIAPKQPLKTFIFSYLAKLQTFVLYVIIRKEIKHPPFLRGINYGIQN